MTRKDGAAIVTIPSYEKESEREREGWGIYAGIHQRRNSNMTGQRGRGEGRRKRRRNGEKKNTLTIRGTWRIDIFEILIFMSLFLQTKERMHLRCVVACTCAPPRGSRRNCNSSFRQYTQFLSSFLSFPFFANRRIEKYLFPFFNNFSINCNGREIYF